MKQYHDLLKKVLEEGTVGQIELRYWYNINFWSSNEI